MQGLDRDFPARSDRVRDGSGVLLAGGVYYYVVFARENSIKAEARLLETTMLARDAELKALKAQLNPHFLLTV